MPRSTLYKRFHGGTSRDNYRPTNTRLTQLEEDILVQEILKLDAYGFGPSLDIVKDIASSICLAKGQLGVGVR